MKHKFKVGDEVAVTEPGSGSIRQTTGVVTAVKNKGYPYRVRIKDGTNYPNFDGELFDEHHLRLLTKLERALR